MLKPAYPISTARLHLRPFKDDDFADLYAYHSLTEVARFLFWQVRNAQETKEALAHKQRQTVLAEEGAVLCLAVCLNESNKVIGEVTLFWRSEEQRQGEIGFVFNPKFGGHGYATEAAHALLSLGFEKLGLHRIYARCDARNVASYKLLGRLGMRCEAHFIHNEIFKGEWGEELVYALLEEEWRRAFGSAVKGVS